MMLILESEFSGSIFNIWGNEAVGLKVESYEYSKPISFNWIFFSFPIELIVVKLFIPDPNSIDAYNYLDFLTLFIFD